MERLFAIIVLTMTPLLPIDMDKVSHTQCVVWGLVTGAIFVFSGRGFRTSRWVMLNRLVLLLGLPCAFLWGTVTALQIVWLIIVPMCCLLTVACWCFSKVFFGHVPDLQLFLESKGSPFWDLVIGWPFNPDSWWTTRGGPPMPPEFQGIDDEIFEAFCLYCNYPLLAEATFCPSCGAIE